MRRPTPTASAPATTALLLLLLAASAPHSSLAAREDVTRGEKTLFFAIDMFNEQLIDGCTVSRSLALNLSRTNSIDESGRTVEKQSTSIRYHSLRTSDSASCIVPFEDGEYTATTDDLVGYSFNRSLGQATLFTPGVRLVGGRGTPATMPRTVDMTVDVYFLPKSLEETFSGGRRTVFLTKAGERQQVATRTKTMSYQMTKNLAGLFGIDGEEPWKFGIGQRVSLTAVLNMSITYQKKIEGPDSMFIRKDD